MTLDREAELRSGLAAYPRRLLLYRHCDGTGVSGTGVVASGVEWPDGHVALRWMADRPEAVSSTSFWSSVAELVQVHGHRGDSEVVYLDEDERPDVGRHTRDRPGPQAEHPAPAAGGSVVPVRGWAARG